MAGPGSILIADDEDTFLKSTARLLRREGYRCDCAHDAGEAIERLRKRWYDLLIADIRMPGNPNLELVRELRQLAHEVPVILVTGYPTLDAAIQSVELPVAAYMTKPVDFAELREQVRLSMQRSQIHRTLADVRQHLQKSAGNLEEIESRAWSSEGTPRGMIDTVCSIAVWTLASSLSELLKLKVLLNPDADQQSLCALIDCPQRPVSCEAIRKTIKVLEQTKSTFKSKQLGELRVWLERLLQESEKSSSSS